MVLELAGETYEIPAMPATDWLLYLMQEQPDIEGLVNEWIPDLGELLLDEVVTLGEVDDLILETLSTVSARPWYVALRLISVARVSWDVLGPEMIRRVDPERHSLAAWLDVLLIQILNSMEPKDTTMFTMRLEAKPNAPGSTGVVPLEEMEMDRGAFLAMGMR